MFLSIFMVKKGKVVWAIVYLVFGIYFINSAFNFITLPDFILNLEKWITLVGGFLILVGGINQIRVGKKLTS